MNSDSRKLILIRHSVSLKTLHHKHGGSGEPLTTIGRLDAMSIGKFLLDNFSIENSTIYCSDVIQVFETANIISSQINTAVEVDNRLKNIYMGVLDGLSDAEMLIRYPEPTRQLQMWREGKLDISKVYIPNAETMDGFRQRVNSFVSEVVSKEDLDTPIIVITRSVGVAIMNFLLGENQNEGKSYSRYKFDPSSISLFSLTRDGASLIYHNRTDFLGREVEFPDV